MNKVLWLASWYPNEREPFSGDFIQRQAEAVALFQPLKILFVGKRPETPSHSSALIIESKSANLKAFILYYESNRNFLSKLNSLFVYLKKHLEIIGQFRKNNEMPDLVHVHVAMKAGLIALFLKWKYKIPYVLTEHWSGYYPQSADSLFNKSIFERYLTKRILKNASLILPVSEALGNQINQYWVKTSFQKILNVVNTLFFFPAPSCPGFFRFIHISTLLYPKNPEGIIRVFAELLKSGMDAELVLVGPGSPELIQTLKTSGLPEDKIQCTGEIPYEAVGAELRKSSALVMFSFYENMPCVILEALCTGIPVIATRVGGLPEVIGESNGILIQQGNEKELLEAMKKMIKNYADYDKEKISRDAVEQFSYETIGKKIVQLYDSVLNK